MTLCCALCEHYIGAGDFNLCCRKKYDLCYADTPACEQFKMDYRARDIYRAGERAQKKYMETRLPKNNYDLIRNMSVGEMAEFLLNRDLHGVDALKDALKKVVDFTYNYDPVECLNGIKEWLMEEIAQSDGG